MGRRVAMLFALNLALVVGFAWFANRFEARGGPDVVDLELSFTSGAFRQILLVWSAAHPGALGMFRTSVLLLDFVFPLAYAAFLSALYVWVVTTGGGRLLQTGRISPWIAAGLDWIENVLLLALVWGLHDSDGIRGATFPPWLVWLMSAVAALKLAFLVVTGALTLAAVFMGPRGRVLRIARFSALSVAVGSLPLIALAQGQDLLVSLATSVSGLLGRIAFFPFLLAWAASVWYWARVLLMVKFESEAPLATDDERAFARAVPRVLGTATLALATGAFLRASATVPRGSGPFWTMLAFAAASGVLAWVFWKLVVRRRALLNRFGFAVPETPLQVDLRQLPRGTRVVVGVSLASSLLFLVLFWRAPLGIAPALGAVTIVLIAAANTVFLGSVGVFLGRWLRVPVVALAFVTAAAFSYWNDNHDVRLARRPDGSPASAALAGRPDLTRAFREWFPRRQQACAGCAQVPVYLVAAEGGGIRAAYWTAVVLAHLTDQRPELAPGLFAISGVSGGSVGAAVYAGLVRDAAQGQLPCAAPGPAQPRLEPCVARILGGSFLAPTLAKLVGPDFAQWFVPVPVHSFDRAWALEDAWAAAYREATLRDTLAEPFLDAWPGPAAGVPALLLNGTHVQTGRRLLASPFRWTSQDLPETDDLLEVLGADVPLATAAHNSTRFSYVSPAGRLRTAEGQDRGHVVDGGYFENSGAATLHDLLHALREDLARDPLPGAPPRFIVLYLCNNPDRCRLLPFEPGSDVAWRRAADLAEWSSPLRALLGAREARGALALAELRQEIGLEGFVELGVCKRLVGRQQEAPLPLGWQISEGVREELDRQVQDPVCGGAAVP